MSYLSTEQVGMVTELMDAVFGPDWRTDWPNISDSWDAWDGAIEQVKKWRDHET